MITSLVLFNPKFTVRALFKLCSFGKHHESFICLREISNTLVLLAIHIGMHLTLAAKAIMLSAGRTTVVI
jgi:hypothetical protein